jgi:hypothetical protein
MTSPISPSTETSEAAHQYPDEAQSNSVARNGLLPNLSRDEARRIGGAQEIIARYEPERAVETLSVLLAEQKDRNQLLTLLERVLADQRVQHIRPSAAQKAMLARICRVLGGAERRRPAPPRGSRLTPGSARIGIVKPRVAPAKKTAGAA